MSNNEQPASISNDFPYLQDLYADDRVCIAIATHFDSFEEVLLETQRNANRVDDDTTTGTIRGMSMCLKSLYFFKKKGDLLIEQASENNKKI